MDWVAWRTMVNRRSNQCGGACGWGIRTGIGDGAFNIRRGILSERERRELKN